MNLSKEIAEMIMQMLDDGNSTAEIRRNDLAERIGCVPSQINYVISSRFTPEHGYIVESHRGGGGYIRITRANYDLSTLKMHLINSIGDRISEKVCRANIINLYDRNLLTDDQTKMILTATSDKNYKVIPEEVRDSFRAELFKQLLLSTMN
ncbi:MAG: CtsR family transcriptional regulator [Ruminococcaceae bacterium]|nr:CtsR family transcriptional regulator [Oscillospiraceae bacterium]